MTSDRRSQFRTGLFECLQPVVGFDSGIIQTPGGGEPTVFNKDLRSIRRAANSHAVYAREIAPLEAVADESGGVAVDTDVFTRAQRSTLRVYREMLVPQGVRCFLLVRLHPPAAPPTSMFLCRQGRGTPFAASSVDAMRELVPSLVLAEALCAERDANRASSAPPPPRVDDASLSARERQIVTLVARGLKNREIAQEFSTSVHTVRKQLVSIFDKLGVATRTELVARFSLETRAPRAEVAE
jgi:DNA-binding CsgD family transcriptional regulator